LQRLQALSARAVMLDDTDATRLVHVSRQDSIAVLERSFKQLTRTVENVAPLEPGTDARDAWQALSQLFDISDGRDLREIIASGIARETETVARERQAADSALKWMRILWLSAAATIALAAVLLATYFTRALRRPLDNLIHGALALERGELNNRIEVVGSDEFSAVAHSLNSMAAELSAHRLREAKTRHELEELVNARTAELQAAFCRYQPRAAYAHDDNTRGSRNHLARQQPQPCGIQNGVTANRRYRPSSRVSHR
jgi:two-component system, OmpR family, sensor kinase